MTALFYILNLTLLLSCLLDLRVKEAERQFSFGLVRILLSVTLLGGEYVYFSFHLQDQSIPSLVFSENVYSLLIIIMAYRMQYTINPAAQKPNLFIMIIVVLAAVVFGTGGFWVYSQPVYDRVEDMIILPQYGLLYFSSLLLLVAALRLAWYLESFWRALTLKGRWEYKFVVIGFFLLSGTFAWSSSYRITYLRLVPRHFQLLSVILLIAWSMMVYGIVRHRLLNRKVFVSRKVVYSTIAPLVFGAYLFFVGIVSFIIRAYGLSLPFILQWLLIIIGILLILIFSLSGKVRHRVKYFISTNFYVNKYEYRDEWLAFSSLLQGELSEKGVVAALRQVLADSLYTTDIKIWLGDAQQGYKPFRDQGFAETPNINLDPDNPLVLHLKENDHFYVADSNYDKAVNELATLEHVFLDTSGIVLLVPLAIGEQCVGYIGLGPEFSGGIYGHDDFDLLAALGSQAASALLATRMAEELAHTREQSAWENLSAYVLHDIKNAATMLSLARENAPAHINNPVFQQDLLESMDDALKRMAKVQNRLHSLKGEITPEWQELVLCKFLKDCIGKLGRKLPELTVDLKCKYTTKITTDPEIFSSILENILLNSLEAGGAGTSVRIHAAPKTTEIIELKITDNGPGIPSELLPDGLFEPFKTSKSKGSGIGLWQVRGLIESLGCNIAAGNNEEGGARFVVEIPAVNDE